MEHFSAFVAERWYVIAAAVIILFLVIKLVKAVVKWAIVLLLIAAVLVYGSQYSGSLQELGQKIVTQTKDEAIKALLGEADQAKFSGKADGSYVIVTPHAKLTGKTDSDTATVTVGGQSFTFKLDEALRKFVTQAQQK